MGAYLEAAASTDVLIAALQRALGDSLKLMVNVCPTEGDAEFVLGHWEALQRYATEDLVQCLRSRDASERARRACVEAIDKALETARHHMQTGGESVEMH